MLSVAVLTVSTALTSYSLHSPVISWPAVSTKQHAQPLHHIYFLVAFSKRERKSPNWWSLGNRSLIPRIPLQSRCAPRSLSQPSHAPLTNTPTGAFHLQLCQTYKGSSSLLGVPNSERHQPRQMRPVKVLAGRRRRRRESRLIFTKRDLAFWQRWYCRWFEFSAMWLLSSGK
jgi:hypothetical protein